LLVADPAAFATVPQAINNEGTIVGDWNDAAGNTHGFIATPH
jgi:probable HAF family extracellular repeat protein